MGYWQLVSAIVVALGIAGAARLAFEAAVTYWALKRRLTRQAQYQAGAKDFAKAVAMAHAEKKLHLLSQSDKLTVQ